jgi:hypothetical protein
MTGSIKVPEDTCLRIVAVSCVLLVPPLPCQRRGQIVASRFVSAAAPTNQAPHAELRYAHGVRSQEQKGQWTNSLIDHNYWLLTRMSSQ